MTLSWSKVKTSATELKPRFRPEIEEVNEVVETQEREIRTSGRKELGAGKFKQLKILHRDSWNKSLMR